MNIKTQRTIYRLLVFLLLALGAYAVSFAALHSIQSDYRAYVAGFAIPFDLMVFVPAAFYFLVVRKHDLSPVIMLPVVALGGAFVFQVARPENPMTVILIATLVVALEITIATRGIIRLGKVFRAAKGETSDPVQWFYKTAYDLLPNHRAAKLLSTELSTIYYVFFTWRKKPSIPEGAQGFSYYKESSYLTIMGVFLCLLPIETVAMHMFLSQWSVGAAWVLTALSGYAILWLLGDCRASILRPVVVCNNTVIVRSGIRFKTTIPVSAIREINSKDPGFSKEETTNLGIMGMTNTWIVLSYPVETETIFGSTEHVQAIGLMLDDVAGFRKALEEDRDRH